METGIWLTLHELEEYLKFSRTKLYGMAWEGEISTSKIGV